MEREEQHSYVTGPVFPGLWWNLTTAPEGENIKTAALLLTATQPKSP